MPMWKRAFLTSFNTSSSLSVGCRALIYLWTTLHTTCTSSTVGVFAWRRNRGGRMSLYPGESCWWQDWCSVAWSLYELSRNSGTMLYSRGWGTQGTDMVVGSILASRLSFHRCCARLGNHKLAESSQAGLGRIQLFWWSPCQTPPRMPCRCLNRSTQPELALNLWPRMLSINAISLAFSQMSASVSVMLFFLVSISHVWRCSSIPGNSGLWCSVLGKWLENEINPHLSLAIPGSSCSESSHLFWLFKILVIVLRWTGYRVAVSSCLASGNSL